jgi:hypothetical protein
MRRRERKALQCFSNGVSQRSYGHCGAMKAMTRATLFHALLPATLLKLGYLAVGLLALPFLALSAFLWNPLIALLLLMLVLAMLVATAGYVGLWIGLLTPKWGMNWRGAAQLVTTVGAAIAALVFFKLHSHFARPGTPFNTEYWTAWALLALAWFVATGPLLVLAWSRPWLRDQTPGLPASKLVVLACWFATAAIAWFGHAALADSIAQRSGRAATPQERRALDPVAAALCAGDLTAAARALDAAGWSQSIDARKILDRCVAHDGWYERLTGRQRQYPERLPIAINAVVAAIRSQQFADDCGPLHVELLRRVVQIDPLALPLVHRAGVHILCWGPDGSQPLWWTALQTTTDPATLRERVRALDSARVQWGDRDGRGETVLGAEVVERLPDDALLQVLEGGIIFDANLRARLAIEIAARAHRAPPAGTDALGHSRTIKALRNEVPMLTAIDIVRAHGQSDTVRRLLSDRTVDRDGLARELADTLVKDEWDVPANPDGLLRALDWREEAVRLERRGGARCKLPTPTNGWLLCGKFDPSLPKRQ